MREWGRQRYKIVYFVCQVLLLLLLVVVVVVVMSFYY
jgi:hypothetical protein